MDPDVERWLVIKFGRAVNTNDIKYIKDNYKDIPTYLKYNLIEDSILRESFEIFYYLVVEKQLLKDRHITLNYWKCFIETKDIRFLEWFLSNMAVDIKTLKNCINSPKYIQNYFRNYCYILNYLESEKYEKGLEND